VDGDELLIAFNPTYLLDGLGVVHADTVRISFTTSARPALLVPVDQGESDAGSNGGSPDVDADGVGDATPAYRYLVMPARLPG
jgi:DNA polymerase-3 subunit beta